MLFSDSEDSFEGLRPTLHPLHHILNWHALQGLYRNGFNPLSHNKRVHFKRSFPASQCVFRYDLYRLGHLRIRKKSDEKFEMNCSVDLQPENFEYSFKGSCLVLKSSHSKEAMTRHVNSHLDQFFGRWSLRFKVIGPTLTSTKNLHRNEAPATFDFESRFFLQRDLKAEDAIRKMYGLFKDRFDRISDPIGLLRIRLGKNAI